MNEIVSSINKIVWNPGLVVLLLGAGLFFSICTRMVQVRRMGLMVRSLFSKKRGTDGISSFEAFCIALSGRVGTGNIVGVATAIAFGGPGAVFWMWVVAFFGASTALWNPHYRRCTSSVMPADTAVARSACMRQVLVSVGWECCLQ